MKAYAPRPTRQRMLSIAIDLTPTNLDFLAVLASEHHIPAKNYLQELVEVALDAKRHHDPEPNICQRLQVQSEVMHSSLNSDGHCNYKR